jgi:hypothetical protein
MPVRVRAFSRERAPYGPTDLKRRSRVGVLKRRVSEFKEDNLTDWAAALTCYGILAIFPALLVLVSVLGLVGESATGPLIDNLGEVAPGPAQEIFTTAIENLQGSHGAAGVFFIVGLAALERPRSQPASRTAASTSASAAASQCLSAWRPSLTWRLTQV